jgi:predicted transcriptional regulator
MTNNNISKTEIVLQILQVANDNAVTHSKLMSKVFLSKIALKECIAELLDNGLLSYDPTRLTFKTTEKGLTIFLGYNQVNQILKDTKSNYIIRA